MLGTCLQVGSTGVTMRSQKEITLKDDLGAKDRLDIYRNFLLYCMSGDVVALPMGSTGEICHSQHCADWQLLSKSERPDLDHRRDWQDGMATCRLSRCCVSAHKAGRRHADNEKISSCDYAKLALMWRTVVQWWWSGTAASLRGCRSWATSWGCPPLRSTPCTAAWPSRPTAAKCSRRALPSGPHVPACLAAAFSQASG